MVWKSMCTQNTNQIYSNKNSSIRMILSSFIIKMLFHTQFEWKISLHPFELSVWKKKENKRQIKLADGYSFARAVWSARAVYVYVQISVLQILKPQRQFLFVLHNQWNKFTMPESVLYSTMCAVIAFQLIWSTRSKPCLHGWHIYTQNAEA